MNRLDGKVALVTAAARGVGYKYRQGRRRRRGTSIPSIANEMRTLSTEAEPLDYIATLLPLRKIGDADDIAKLIIFLASDDSGFVTGSEYLINGGAMPMGTLELVNFIDDGKAPS